MAEWIHGSSMSRIFYLLFDPGELIVLPLGSIAYDTKARWCCPLHTPTAHCVLPLPTQDPRVRSRDNFSISWVGSWLFFKEFTAGWGSGVEEGDAVWLRAGVLGHVSDIRLSWYHSGALGWEDSLQDPSPTEFEPLCAGRCQAPTPDPCLGSWPNELHIGYLTCSCVRGSGRQPVMSVLLPGQVFPRYADRRPRGVSSREECYTMMSWWHFRFWLQNYKRYTPCAKIIEIWQNSKVWHCDIWKCHSFRSLVQNYVCLLR